MKRLVIFQIMLVFFLSVNAESQSALLDSAANYYTAGKYEQAISTYERIVKNGYEAAELYFNLGNAYYKSNKFPMAIVNYERALKLAPKNEDIQFNLQLANMHVVDKIDTVPEFFLVSWLNQFIKKLSSNQWALISVSAFVFGLVFFLVFFLSNRVTARRFSFWLGIVLIIGSLFTFNYSRKQKWFALNEPSAIVMTPSVVVKSSPDMSGTELFLIHEGLKIKVIDELGEWCEIKLPDGNKGWVKHSDLVII